MADEVWPDFLQASLRCGGTALKERDAALKETEMQDMKKAGMAHCRWRDLGVSYPAPQLEGMLLKMKTEIARHGDQLADLIWNRVDVDDGQSLTARSQAFLVEMHESAMEITTWRDEPAVQADNPRVPWATLFEQLPHVVYEKFPRAYRGPLLEKHKAIMGLVNKHSGEIVEVAAGQRPYPDHQMPVTKWALIRAGQSLTADLSEQYWVWDDGRTAEERDEKPFLISEDEVKHFNRDVRMVAPAGSSGEDLKGLEPDWRRQKYRIVCSCRNNENYMWVRTGSVTNLGNLLVVLSDTFTANEIYYAYLHFPIVAVKRKPHKSKGTPTGMKLNKGCVMTRS
jgi:hypothetical protein